MIVLCCTLHRSSRFGLLTARSNYLKLENLSYICKLSEPKAPHQLLVKNEKQKIDNNEQFPLSLSLLGRRVRPRPLKDGFRAPPLSTLSNLQLNPYGICLSLPSLDLSKSPSIVLSAPPSAPSLLFQTPPAAWPPPSPGEI